MEEVDFVGMRLDGLVRKVVGLREGVLLDVDTCPPPPDRFPPLIFFLFFFFFSLSGRGGGFPFPGVWMDGWNVDNLAVFVTKVVPVRRNWN